MLTHIYNINYKYKLFFVKEHITYILETTVVQCACCRLLCIWAVGKESRKNQVQYYTVIIKFIPCLCTCTVQNKKYYGLEICEKKTSRL